MGCGVKWVFVRSVALLLIRQLAAVGTENESLAKPDGLQTARRGRDERGRGRA